jgi:hypothetical protein
LLDTEEHYDDPFGAALLGMWTSRADDDGAWVKRPTDAEVITGTGLFDTPIKRTDAQRIARPVDVVAGRRRRFLVLAICCARQFAADR